MSNPRHGKEGGTTAEKAAIFIVSLVCISLELLLARILNLKTWNHVIYVVIPFAILGYGIGAQLYLLSSDRLRKIEKRSILAGSCLLLSALCVFTTVSLIKLPIHFNDLENLFKDPSAAAIFGLCYAVLALPFVVIGFLVVFLFSDNPALSPVLYFWDLLGAGTGAVAFFFLISELGAFRSVTFLSALLACFGIFLVFSDRRWRALPLCLLCLLALGIPEPSAYDVDPSKGWEYIPGSLKPGEYERVLSRWSPLGRTDAYRIKDEATRARIRKPQQGTFEIDLAPPSEFSYFCTNFIAGTPVYKLSPEGLDESGSQVRLFSQAMEFPYVLLKEPRVVIIGTGGGRDIFMAKTHGAVEVTGAEVNPVTYSEMSPGGKFHEYSGGVYTLDGVSISNQDGRHLVKRLEPGSADLLVLNGVDSYSGLSSGAYVYAESYLYTRNAVTDYLRVLKEGGMINFNRWFYPKQERETLRLFVIALEALRQGGAREPWEHVLVGHHAGWGMMLVKKSPFTPKERSAVSRYFQEHDTELIYPSEQPNAFGGYTDSLKAGKEKSFIAGYRYDISPVDDDKPFFFKYYRLGDFRPKKLSGPDFPVTGTVIFLSQMVALFHAVVFICLFIFLPLFLLNKSGLKSMPGRARGFFVLYFSCLGLGFMFIEIPTMQRFTLFLGSPLHSISVTLAALLIWSGLGSSLLPRFQWAIRRTEFLPAFFLAVLLTSLLFLTSIAPKIMDYFMDRSFAERVAATSLILLPLGLCLGTFFPLGLQFAGRRDKEAVAWAWGINCGFTVLGSLLAIILAQFYGFNHVLLLAAFCYAAAAWAFKELTAA